MVIYIPNHLKNNIPILKSLSDMIIGYNSEYSTVNQSESFKDYFEYLSNNPVRSFIKTCLEEKFVEDKTEEEEQESIINYLFKLFYSVKGTSLVFDYMKKYLGLKIKKIIKYTVSEISFEIEEVSVKNLQHYVDLLKEFLSLLLFYGDLVVNIQLMNLILKEDLSISVNNDIQKYKEYNLTESFKF